MSLTVLLRAAAAARIVFAVTTSVTLADTVVVSADRMVDVLTDRIIERPQITITDGRIVAVGAQGAAVADGARRVDLKGMTLLPGLIDMHTHLTSDPHFSGYRRLQFTDNFGPWSASPMR
jgi:imidazolonepropionase-like amidohydrolase